MTFAVGKFGLSAIKPFSPVPPVFAKLTQQQSSPLQQRPQADDGSHETNIKKIWKSEQRKY
jgi:hypothetical protein